MNEQEAQDFISDRMDWSLFELVKEAYKQGHDEALKQELSDRDKMWLDNFGRGRG